MPEHLAIEFEWRPVGGLAVDRSRLVFPQFDDVAGIYRFDLRQLGQADTSYVGESDRLRRRFQHYRTPGPSQPTNIRLNTLMIGVLGAGGTVSVSVCTAASIECTVGTWQPLDLQRKAGRVLLEQAALQLLSLQGRTVLNL